MKHALAVYRRLLPLMRPYVPVLLLGAALAIVVAAMEGAIAWLVKPALDDIFIRRDQAMLRLIPLLLLGAYLVKGTARYGQAYLMAAVGERVVATASKRWFAWTDTYGVDVEKGEDDVLLLAAVVVIDQACHHRHG